MGEIHQLLLEFGREEAIKRSLDRRVVEAAASFLAAEDTDIGFIYSGWAQAALPHRRQPDDALWQVKTDRLSLIVQPGVRDTLAGPVRIGVPYGSRARLILIYLQSEALRTSCRQVELGKSLRVWLGRMGIPIGGKSIAEVKDQAARISGCTMTFEIMAGNKSGFLNQQLIEGGLFEDGDFAQKMIEQVTLSESFYTQLQRHPVPIAEAAISALANNSMALDAYCWLAYRLHSLTTPMPISWAALHAQFGLSFSEHRHFVPHFRGILDLTLAVYPAAKVAMNERGVTLYPSPPPVSRR